MEAYKPVSEEFREELEVLGAIKKNCHIRFIGDNGAVASLCTQVLGVYTDDGADYLKTGSGLQIRLDRLVEVDGKPPEQFSV